MARLIELFFLPSMAIARVGSSPEPLGSFRYARGTTRRDAVDTRIEPAISLKVADDGSVLPYMPRSISFKDSDGAIRPVAPFFELWCRLEATDGAHSVVPVTPKLLASLGTSTRNLEYEITLANLKAARRTGYAACGFRARESIAGYDYEPRALLAISPHTADQQPLVLPDKPIPLGSLRVIRPVDRQDGPFHDKVDCSVLRVRYTPPKGHVYGPPTAINGPAPEVMPGVYESAGIQFGRIHEIVPPERRILNPNTPWSSYIMLNGTFEDPQPQDGYDGAAVGSFMSWACVDDTCDGTLVATLAVAGQRYRAVARIIVSPPDFAPDRRPIFSAAHDIVDRELPPPADADDYKPVAVDSSNYDAVKEEIVDLFERAFEHASLFNLDALRTRALQENRQRFAMHSGPPGPDVPSAGDASMTSADQPYVDKLPTLAPQAPSRFTKAVENQPLPYTAAVGTIHGPLKNEAVLVEFLKRRGDFVKRIVRPPFGRLRQFPEFANADPNPAFRDPRVFRDQLNDMRMPPYIRDANIQPLSITWRQYHLLMNFIDYLQKNDGKSADSAREPA